MLKRELAIEVELEEGRYGEFTVLVDGVPAVETGLLAALGVVPRNARILEAVRARLAGAAS